MTTKYGSELKGIKKFRLGKKGITILTSKPELAKKTVQSLKDMEQTADYYLIASNNPKLEKDLLQVLALLPGKNKELLILSTNKVDDLISFAMKKMQEQTCTRLVIMREGLVLKKPKAIDTYIFLATQAKLSYAELRLDKHNLLEEYVINKTSVGLYSATNELPYLMYFYYMLLHKAPSRRKFAMEELTISNADVMVSEELFKVVEWEN